MVISPKFSFLSSFIWREKCYIVFSSSISTLIDDIAVDWINDKLYWADATLQKVEVLDMNTGVRSKLFDTGTGTIPRGIAVDPNRR